LLPLILKNLIISHNTALSLCKSNTTMVVALLLPRGSEVNLVEMT